MLKKNGNVTRFDDEYRGGDVGDGEEEDRQHQDDGHLGSHGRLAGKARVGISSPFEGEIFRGSVEELGASRVRI